MRNVYQRKVGRVLWYFQIKIVGINLAGVELNGNYISNRT